MKLGEFSVRQPVLVNMLVVVVLVAGVLTYSLLMNREVFPETSKEAVSVLIIYPGTSPKQMERLVAIPIEDEIKDVEGIDSILTTCGEGRCEISIQFEAGENIAERKTDVKDEVDKVTLPKEAEDPIVDEVSVSFARMVIAIGIGGTVGEHRLVEIADDLEDALDSITGVSAILVSGRRDREIWVRVDPVRMEQHGLDAAMVANAIRRRNINLPAGSIKSTRDEIVVRTEGDVGEALDPKREIEDVIVKSAPRGGEVRVRDIATVEDTFEEATSLARVNGLPALNLTVFKQKRGDIIQIADDARTRVAAFEKTLPEGVELSVVVDMSYWVRNRLRTVSTNGLLGLGLVLIILFLFMNGRMAIITAFGIPFSLAGALLFMHFAGISINMLSLFSLIIVLGMIVDDAIIVTENIYRHMTEGMPPREAAILGTAEVTLPVICTVLTTIAAFIPMLMMTGMIGKFLSIIPKVVTIALLASLAEALLVLPSHMADFVRPHTDGRMTRFRNGIMTGLTRVYEPLLRIGFRHRYLATLLVMAAAAGSVWLAVHMRFELFPFDEVKVININVETSPQRKLAETARVVEKVEQAALALPEQVSVSTRVGIWLLDSEQLVYAKNKAQIAVEILDPEERPKIGPTGEARTTDELIAALREGVGDLEGAVSVEYLRQRGGPPVGRPIFLRVRGNDFETLEAIATEVEEFLSTLPGVTDIRNDFEEGKLELRVHPDEPRLRRYGLDRLRIAQTVRYAYEGGEATELRRGNDEVDVIVKYPEGFERDRASVSQIKVLSPVTQKLVPIRNFATVGFDTGYTRVVRYDRKRAITISANITAGQISSKDANARVRKTFADIPLRYPGYSLAFGGEEQETVESLASLRAASIVALLLIYAILVSLFNSFGQPLVVMFTVPFSLIGVVAGLYVAGQPISMLAMIGTVALAGIVVNDSLVMVDFINRARRDGMPREEAVIQSGLMRLRPIILTTVTTCGGLLPTAMGIASGLESFLSPFAIALVSGLAFATLLTLLAIPCIYAIVDDMANILKRLFKPITRWLVND
ncbi:efflux RND transporter permease subunit [bacterium]|nr:efflux RND transporter permease subunit [bacterium]